MSNISEIDKLIQEINDHSFNNKFKPEQLENEYVESYITKIQSLLEIIGNLPEENINHYQIQISKYCKDISNIINLLHKKQQLIKNDILNLNKNVAAQKAYIS